jgi:hypothetical protein
MIERDPAKAFWMDKQISEMTREELINVVLWQAAKLEEYWSPAAIRASSLGRVEMFKRGED